MGKWKRVDPAEIRVGDRVKRKAPNYQSFSGLVTDTGDSTVWFGDEVFAHEFGTWYIRTPKKPKPPARPDEQSKDLRIAELEEELYWKSIGLSKANDRCSNARRERDEILERAGELEAERDEFRALAEKQESEIGVLRQANISYADTCKELEAEIRRREKDLFKVIHRRDELSNRVRKLEAALADEAATRHIDMGLRSPRGNWRGN